ncbi:hypothetical protein EIK77_000295 [Talaromyces pinophilus]|nr:hypothetical protein EIK77_000295 [Talaromyces pinophilus]
MLIKKSIDCLTLDIVRPSGVSKNNNLPVFVWIYGGNFVAGSSADPRYNTSYIVNASVVIDKPIIAVSVNYRLGGWGFLASKEVAAAGESNIGLYDQRLALRWIHENIRDFGGDPTKVTIAGESAGGFSVGYHLTAFDGRNNGLFRAAIMESGNSMGPAVYPLSQLDTTYQPIYDNITKTVHCSKATDTLECLRHVPYKAFYDAAAPFAIYPIVDGDFLTRLPSESFAQGLIADVAILAGTNTDECTAFAPRRTPSKNSRITPALAVPGLGLGGILDTDRDVRTLISEINGGLNDTIVTKIMELYPDDPVQGCPFGTGSERFDDQGGYQYKRGAALIADEIFHAGRRHTVNMYASRPKEQRKPVYSFRFDQTPWNGIEQIMAPVAPCNATHFSEICHVFNIHPSISINHTNWIGPLAEYYELSKLMSRAWISFVHDLDPNNHGITHTVPHWPDYSMSLQNFVFRVNESVVEDDDWRLEQLEYWGRIWGQLSA